MDLIHGDCKDHIDDITYDYVFTGPPDFDDLGMDPTDTTGYSDWLKPIIEKMKPRNGLITIVVTDRKFKRGVVSKAQLIQTIMGDLGKTLASYKIWMKSDKIGHFRLTYSHIMTFSDKDHRGHPVKYWQQVGYQEFKPDVWYMKPKSYKGYNHNTPVELVDRCILNYTKEGDTVYDPFAGSCTTGVSAKQNKRIFIGTELREDTYLLGLERLQLTNYLTSNPTL